MAKNRVRPWVKIVGIVAVVAGIGIGLTQLSKNGSGEKTNLNLFGSKTGKNDVVTLAVNTYAGFTPIIEGNGGLEGNENSPFFKKFGVKLKILSQDDFLAGRNAFKNGDVQLIYCTTDVRPTELGNSSDMVGSKQVMILNYSRGADALVVRKGINTVADLKGKKVAVAVSTASHTLLLNILETNGLTQNDIQLIKVESGLEAAQIFKALQVDAACVWAPDDADILAAMPGTKVLFSTKEAANLITDGLIVKDDYLEKNYDKVKNIVEAILWANSELNNSEAKVEAAAKIAGKAFGTDEDFVISGCGNIRFATLEDNANFFGLNASYTGTTGDQIYSKMARVYEQLSLTNKPIGWRKASDTHILEDLLANNKLDNDQTAEKAKTFDAPSREIAGKEAVSNKIVIIEFASNSALLDADAKAIIDSEIAPIAKQFSGARIRIQGNTDNTGSAEVNKPLSLKRAQAMADYLIKEYAFDRNRFIVVGNGSEKAIKAGSTGADKSFRITEFQLISE
ncbi:MAG: OmpA family protein [Bacteroidales bacterium]|jgi:NitT/TauT family transport system substrate-binding protein|nr:OmpA family protein [Bacteroidales bacterium]